MQLLFIFLLELFISVTLLIALFLLSLLRGLPVRLHCFVVVCFMIWYAQFVDGGVSRCIFCVYAFTFIFVMHSILHHCQR